MTADFIRVARAPGKSAAAASALKFLDQFLQNPPKLMVEIRNKIVEAGQQVKDKRLLRLKELHSRRRGFKPGWSEAGEGECGALRGAPRRVTLAANVTRETDRH